MKDDPKFRLKMLNRPGITSRSGTPSSRNLAKPFRHQRIVTDKKTGLDTLHPLDNMKSGPSYSFRKDQNGQHNLVIKSLEERHSNTTGSFGEVSSFQGNRVDTSNRPVFAEINPNLDRAARISVTTKLPGRSGRGKIRKRAGDATPKHHYIDYSRKLKAELINLRADILTMDAIGQFFGKPFVSEELRVVLEAINARLIGLCKPGEYEKLLYNDENRKKSVIGQCKSQGIQNVERVKSLDQRIRRALHVSKVAPPTAYVPQKPPQIYKPNCVGLGA